MNTRIKEFVRPALTSGSIRGAVRDYIVGGARKQRVVTKYGEISNWDVSNVTNMENMFELEGAVSFNQPLNKWNVSNVRDMYRMFAGARSFNQSLNKWNVSNVRYMAGMFMHANSFMKEFANANIPTI